MHHQGADIMVSQRKKDAPPPGNSLMDVYGPLYPSRNMNRWLLADASGASITKSCHICQDQHVINGEHSGHAWVATWVAVVSKALGWD